METEIFDEENSMLLSDEFAAITLDLNLELKEYTVQTSLKEDVYYRTEKYQYRITGNPIIVEIRLVERYDEPPLEYLVKDGVVLESEMKKGLVLGDIILDLKKNVEWHKLDFSQDVTLLLYILYKHPEIISPEDYRRYVRQNIERLKIAITKVEQFLNKNYPNGPKIIETKYDTNQIWYEDANKQFDKDLDLENLNNKVKFIEENIYNKLFEPTSPDYVGISKNDFSYSATAIKKGEEFLDGTILVANNLSEAQPVRQGVNKLWIVIILAVVALYWSVWTAIGIFILGSILLSILKQNK